MSFASIDDLRSQLGHSPATAEQRSAYAEKMLHAVPSAPVVDRAALILDRVKGKRVLECGASGPMHEKIRAVAADYMGVDRDIAGAVVGFDLDDVERERLPVCDDAEVIVCGEILEHLSNPGHFLARLAQQYRGVPVLITVPNAFSESGRHHILKGVENVNRDHVAYYSFKTLSVLLSRHGYRVAEFAWYNGRPGTAEGLIMIAETLDG